MIKVDSTWRKQKNFKLYYNDTNKKKKIEIDYLYENELVYKLINRILKSGKKSLAYKIVYSSMRKLNEKDNESQNPIQILEKAVKNTSPTVEVRAKRIGGAVYQIPVKVSPQRAQSLSLRWLLMDTKSKPNKELGQNLANAILDASKGSGGAVKKKEELHRSAEANRAIT